MRKTKRYNSLLTPKMRTLLSTLLTLSLLSCLLACSSSRISTENKRISAPIYDVVVVGAGPAGIGAALAAAKTGARTLLIERDNRVGGTTVQAEVCDIGLFHARMPGSGE